MVPTPDKISRSNYPANYTIELCTNIVRSRFLKETNRNYSAGVTAHPNVAACLAAADPRKDYVVQPHYAKPMLRDGRKFHIRLYILGFSPLGTNNLEWYYYRSDELLMGRVATSGQNFVLKMMNLYLKMMNLYLKLMNFVPKMMNFVSKCRRKVVAAKPRSDRTDHHAAYLCDFRGRLGGAYVYK